VAHITGGGIPGNLVRALPEGLDALVGRSALPVPQIFTEIQRHGGVSDEEMSRVFNMGIGMILIVEADGADAVLTSLEASGHDCAPVGVVVPGSRNVVLS
jgi:phosphoribosylformylglycinamidine cyclo-ligase